MSWKVEVSSAIFRNCHFSAWFLQCYQDVSHIYEILGECLPPNIPWSLWLLLFLPPTLVQQILKLLPLTASGSLMVLKSSLNMKYLNVGLNTRLLNLHFEAPVSKWPLAWLWCLALRGLFGLILQNSMLFSVCIVLCYRYVVALYKKILCLSST